MKIIRAIDRILDPIEKWCSIFCLLGLIAVVFLQVILRALGVPFYGADETSRLLFVWCVYVGAAHASRNRKHLKIDIIAGLVKNDTLHSVLNLFEDIVVAVLLIIFIPVSMGLVQKFLESGQESPVLHYNVALAYAAPAVFFVFATIRHIENIVQEIQKIIQKRATKLEEGSEVI